MNATHAPHCPRCRVALTVGHARNITLHACAECGGVWLDNTCARRIVQAYEADAIAMAERISGCANALVNTSVTGIPCATCDRPMNVKRMVSTKSWINDVDIDVCSEHGTWFDANELAAVANVLSDGRPPTQRSSSKETISEWVQVAGDGARTTYAVTDVGGNVTEVGTDAIEVLETTFEIVGGVLGVVFEF